MPKKTPVEEQPDVPEEILAEEVTPEMAAAESGETPDAQAELATLKDQHLRLMAEYDNYRKRSQKEREALYTDIRAETLKKLLPVMDNLERAVAAPCQDTAYAQGVEMTFKQCAELFLAMGVKAIESEGKPFDPNFHDAVMHAKEEGTPENTIVQVFQQGYVMGDRVLRHAMVKVVN